MKSKRNVLIGVTFLVLLAALVAGQNVLRNRAVAEAFQKNPSWDALFGDVVYVDGKGRKIYQREEAVYDFKVLLYAVDYICPMMYPSPRYSGVTSQERVASGILPVRPVRNQVAVSFQKPRMPYRNL